jgi:hypothetical protein
LLASQAEGRRFEPGLALHRHPTGNDWPSISQHGLCAEFVEDRAAIPLPGLALPSFRLLLDGAGSKEAHRCSEVQYLTLA